MKVARVWPTIAPHLSFGRYGTKRNTVSLECIIAADSVKSGSVLERIDFNLQSTDCTIDAPLFGHSAYALLAGSPYVGISATKSHEWNKMTENRTDGLTRWLVTTSSLRDCGALYRRRRQVQKEPIGRIRRTDQPRRQRHRVKQRPVKSWRNSAILCQAPICLHRFAWPITKRALQLRSIPIIVTLFACQVFLHIVVATSLWCHCT